MTAFCFCQFSITGFRSAGRRRSGIRAGHWKEKKPEENPMVKMLQGGMMPDTPRATTRQTDRRSSDVCVTGTLRLRGTRISGTTLPDFGLCFVPVNFLLAAVRLGGEGW